MKEKIIKLIKRIIIDIVIIFGGLFFVSLFLFAPASYNHKLQEARDTSAVTLGEDMVKHLNTLEIYDFENIIDYHEKYAGNMPYKNCYYLSPIENKKDYILVQPLESNKYKKKYGGDYILHKSDENYIIIPERWKKIQIVISDSCDNVYKKTDQ